MCNCDRKESWSDLGLVDQLLNTVAYGNGGRQCELLRVAERLLVRISKRDNLSASMTHRIGELKDFAAEIRATH